MIDCENCRYCKFEQGKGRPGKYFCLHPRNPSVVKRIAGYKIICSTERRSTEFTIKKTPKWCPIDNEIQKIVEFYTNPPKTLNGNKIKQSTLNKIMEDINANCRKKKGEIK